MRWIVFTWMLLISGNVLALQAPPGLQFDVARYEVSGANPLPAEVVANLLKPYLGRHFGLEGLSAAVAEFEQALKKAGYSFHRVVLPPQSMEQGIVKLEVHEFTLGQLKASGQKYFSTENILNSLPSMVVGKAPNTRLLNKNLQLANQHPDKNIQMVFKEGTKANTIDIDLKVNDKSPHTSYMQLTNTGTEDTGEIRLALGYQFSNLFDKDHITSLSYSTSVDKPDDVSQWLISYSMPFYSRGDQLSFYYSDSAIATNTSIGSTSFDISGAGSVLGSRYQQTLKQWKGYKQKIIYGLDVKEFDNTINTSSSSLQSQPLSVEYEISKPKIKTPYKLSISLYQNLSNDQDAYDNEVRTPDTNWQLFRYRARYEYPISNWLMKIKLEGQIANQALISGEQFAVGGSQSVRGYGEREVLGDSGYGLNFEIWKKTKTKNLSWLMFYDLASVKYSESICDTCAIKQSISSLGAGLRWTWSRHVSVVLDVAQVLEDYEQTLKGDNKAHVSLTYQY